MIKEHRTPKCNRDLERVIAKKLLKFIDSNSLVSKYIYLNILYAFLVGKG